MGVTLANRPLSFPAEQKRQTACKNVNIILFSQTPPLPFSPQLPCPIHLGTRRWPRLPTPTLWPGKMEMCFFRSHYLNCRCNKAAIWNSLNNSRLVIYCEPGCMLLDSISQRNVSAAFIVSAWIYGKQDRVTLRKPHNPFIQALIRKPRKNYPSWFAGDSTRSFWSQKVSAAPPCQPIKKESWHATILEPCVRKNFSSGKTLQILSPSRRLWC